MKILVLTQYFFPHAGGSQEYILELYTELLKQYPGYTVDVVCYNTVQAKKVETFGQLKVYRVECVQLLPGQFALPNYVELFALLRTLKQKRGSYDFVNSHTRFFDNSWWSPLVAQYVGARSILTDHCASHPVYPNRVVSSLITVFDNFLARFVPKLYNHVTVVSTATANFLTQHGYSRSIDVIYAGVNPTLFSSQHTKNIVNKPKGSLVITYLGRMIPSKNPGLVYSVAQKLLQKHSNIQFLFAGSGSEFERLKKYASTSIRFLGQLSKSEVGSLLKQTDIFVHPSLHHEGLPIAVLEAGQSGTAVIAADNGATGEVIDNKINGLLIKPTERELEQALTSLIVNKKIRTAYGKKLKTDISRNFSWNVSAKQLNQLLHKWQ